MLSSLIGIAYKYMRACLGVSLSTQAGSGSVAPRLGGTEDGWPAIVKFWFSLASWASIAGARAVYALIQC